MARIRSLKPEFWEDEDLARELSREVRLFYLALWNQCDEEARMRGNPGYIKGHCFPYDDDVTAGLIDAWLDTLERTGRVVRYTDQSVRTGGGSAFLFLPKLAKHQKLDPRLQSRHPAPPAETPSAPDPPPIHTDESVRIDVENTDPPALVDASAHAGAGALQVAGGKGQVAGGRDARKRAHQMPPDFAPSNKHRALAAELGVNLDPEVDQFRDFHTAKGSTFKDWDAALRTWLRNAAKFNGGRNIPRPNRNGPDWEASLAHAQALDAAEGGHP